MRIALSLLLVLAVAVPGLAGDEASAPAIRVGDAVPAFSLPTLDGGSFSLADARSLDAEKALAEVVAAAGGTDVTGETTLASLPGMDDPAKVRAFLVQVGRPHGLIPAADAHEDVETVGDVATWIAESANAPMIFMCWSPMCPTSRGYEDRIQAIVAEMGARFYPLASNSLKRERNEDCLQYVKDRKLPYRVLLDREQKACDVFGGQVTPHVFVVDAENRLAYAGSIDSDPRCKTTSEDDRQNWLVDALEALADERPVYVLRTTPKG